MIKEITVRTGNRNEMNDITAEIRRLIVESGVRDGVCHIFVPHTTAAVTINEKADPDVAKDISAALEKIVPAGFNVACRLPPLLHRLSVAYDNVLTPWRVDNRVRIAVPSSPVIARRLPAPLPWRNSPVFSCGLALSWLTAYPLRLTPQRPTRLSA